MFCMLKKEKKYPAYVSKNNSNHEKQVILWMISNKEKREAHFKGCVTKSEGRRWQYLAVKKLPALSKGITLKNNSDLYCSNCLHSFRKKIKNLNCVRDYLNIKTFVMQLCLLKTLKY